MSTVLIYDKTTKAIKQILYSVNTPDYNTRDDVIINPDLSPIAGIPFIYGKVEAGAVKEMTAAEKDAVNASFPAPTPDPVELLKIDVADLKKRVEALEKI
jgi:hypothetical protein